MHTHRLFSLLGLILAVSAAEARVKLVALPDRARVVVSLANLDATLVEEERVLTLQKGVNQVDFAWRGVSIDPASIQLRMLDQPDQVQLLNTSYPPNENALIWAISSPVARAERMRISYLLQGISREVVYRAVSEPDEKSLALRNYLRVRNNSGEDLENAEIGVGYGKDFKRSIQHQEVLELLSERVDQLPIKKILTWDAGQMPWDPEYEKNTIGVPLSYVIKNDKASKLGAHTLQPGKVRIFIKTKEVAEGDAAPGEGVAFTGEDWGQLTPVDREMKLYIGQSRDVKVTQRKTTDERINLRRNNGNSVVMWDQNEVYKVEIENFKTTAVTLVIVEHIPGYWKMIESTLKYEKKDAFTIEYTLDLAPKTTGDKKTVLNFNVRRMNVQGNEPSNY
ncbi:MAG: hypothetical protein EXS22_08860 [Pedosphaera sp.]|nr:hypothetical protein [Pedosphaera sp.]MSU44130.1 hypothetical protein [Pedosphaera sp.]